MRNGSELRHLLEDSLVERDGERARIVRVECRASPYRTTCPIEEVDVLLGDGTRLELLKKDLDPDALAADARVARPPFLARPNREIEVYRRFLSPARVGPRLHGAVSDPLHGRYWLLLERVRGSALYEVGDQEVWRDVARWLARFHTALPANEELRRQAGAAGLLRCDALYFHRWPVRAHAFVAGGPAGERRERLVLERLARRYDRIVERLVGLPVSMIHGDFFPSNVILRAPPCGSRVCPVDWEMAAVGPGLLDLAALTAGRWSEADKAGIALAYHAEALRLGARVAPSETDFLQDWMVCRLQLAVQLLGWSPGWVPPPEHQHDWLAEVGDLAPQLL